MATKIDLSKIDLGGKLKINKAQQDMLLAVTVTSILLGICVVLGIYFVKLVLFNQVVIKEKKAAIAGYSAAIEEIGICKSPNSSKRGYEKAELDECDPNTINVTANLDAKTLRYKVLIDLAQNADLESVGRTGISVCVDPKTGSKRKYSDLYNDYLSAVTTEEQNEKYQLLAMCSALRAVPDALPAIANELALMSSLDRIFRISNWTPESITPGEFGVAEVNGKTLGTIGVKIEAEADTSKIVQILRNIEKSIREIDLKKAEVSFRSGNLEFSADGVAYYTGQSSLNEGVVTIRGDGKVNKTSSGSIIDTIAEEE